MTAGQVVFVAMFGGGGLLFLLIGAAFALYVAVVRRDAARMTASAVGTVVDYHTVISSGENGESVCHSPVVTYPDAGGTTRTAVVNGAATKPFEVGQRVDVRYDPNNFGRAVIVGHESAGLGETLTFGVAFGLFGVGGVLTAGWVLLTDMPVGLH